MSMLLEEVFDYGEDEDDEVEVIDVDIDLPEPLPSLADIPDDNAFADNEEMPMVDTSVPGVFKQPMLSPDRGKRRSEGDLSSRWTSPSASTAGDSGIDSVASLSHVEVEKEAEALVIRQRSHSPEIFPPELDPNLVQRLRSKKCYLAYHQYPTYPKIKPDYDFLKKRNRPANTHQLLHLCHDGTEAELLTRLEELVGDVFHYTKVVIFARRRERLLDIKWGLKKHCKLECLLIDSHYEVEKIVKVCDYFADCRRRILLCHTHILPSKKALKDTNLVIWWNQPRTVEDFMEVKSRLTVPKALILVILKQEDDWQFLDAMENQAGLVFPEFALNSVDEVYAGFINSRIGQNLEEKDEVTVDDSD